MAKHSQSLVEHSWWTKFAHVSFDFHLSWIGSWSSWSTTMREPIALERRVAVTMWRLATNVKYRNLGELFGLGCSTVGKIRSALSYRSNTKAGDMWFWCLVWFSPSYWCHQRDSYSNHTATSECHRLFQPQRVSFFGNAGSSWLFIRVERISKSRIFVFSSERIFEYSSPFAWGLTPSGLKDKP